MKDPLVNEKTVVGMQPLPLASTMKTNKKESSSMEKPERTQLKSLTMR